MAAALDDTIVALSSGRPPAAIAVIRSSGPHALRIAERLAGPLPPPRHASLRLLKHPADGALIDRALLIVFPGPDTATGEDVVEYQCHGGKAVIDALIGALVDSGSVRLAEPGEFTRRALANGRIDLTQAQGLADLLEAETEVQRRGALLRTEGALRTLLARWRAALLGLAAEAEVAIDYADEEDGQGDFDPAARIAALVAEMDALLAAPRLEKLRDGVRVVVAGPPNAGKSSLVNALAGEARAIVTEIAGTTRDRIEVPLALAGLPVVLVDTAGLRDSDDPIERIGVGLSRDELVSADLILWLGAAADLPRPDAVLVATKCDLGMRPGVPVSATTGAGLAELKALIIDRARTITPAQGQLSLSRREASLLEETRAALTDACALADPLLIAEHLRSARTALDRLAGHAGVDDLLDALFSRFCLGK